MSNRFAFPSPLNFQCLLLFQVLQKVSHTITQTAHCRDLTELPTASLLKMDDVCLHRLPNLLPTGSEWIFIIYIKNKQQRTYVLNRGNGHWGFYISHLDVNSSLWECSSAYVWASVCFFSVIYLRSPCHAGVPAARPKLRARGREKWRQTHTHTLLQCTVSTITATCLLASLTSVLAKFIQKYNLKKIEHYFLVQLLAKCMVEGFASL